MTRVFNHCYAEVYNRGRPKDEFLNELVDWAIGAPDIIFERNEISDIYTSIRPELGEFGNDLKHRKAVMLEVLRVLAGFESSWDWLAGRDTTNPTSNTPCTEEAGILQCSGNSMNYDPSLKALLKSVSGKTDCPTFITVSKQNHPFVLEYCARLLRFKTTHHGPVKRKEINSWLRKDAIAEFKNML